MPIVADASDDAVRTALNALLVRQRAAQLRDGAPSAAIRIDRLNRCIALLVDHRSDIEAALSADFGARSSHVTAFADVASSIGPLKHARSHVTRWMKTERRGTTPGIFGLFGAKAEIRYQPKGVVGVISPWNFPVNLTFGPLAGVLAAGNRAMVKPSEMTPATSELMKKMFASAFDEEEIAVVTGGPDVGQAFASLAFDHIIFTGATSIGRHVMKAAAENLVPVTLELGGKSPVILGRSADLATSAARIMNGKTLNAGQICLAPDSAVVADRHYERLTGYLDDARAKGAEIVEINPAGEDLRQQPHRRMAPTLILHPTDDMKVMQEEIFGPLLPVKAYQKVDEAIDYVNAHDRPLGLYYFGSDSGERDQVVDRTTSGGVSVNDVVMHVAQEELPFGGIGPAGMGAYHGHDGFREFSHRKSVFHQMKNDFGLRMLRPPYGVAITRYLASQIRR